MSDESEFSAIADDIEAAVAKMREAFRRHKEDAYTLDEFRDGLLLMNGSKDEKPCIEIFFSDESAVKFYLRDALWWMLEPQNVDGLAKDTKFAKWNAEIFRLWAAELSEIAKELSENADKIYPA